MKNERALHLDLPTDTPFLRRAAFTAVRPFFTRVLGLRGLEPVYRAARTGEGPSFAARVLRAMNVDVAVAGVASIPPSGPLVVVANHPHGMVDGLLLAEAAGRVRDDVRVVASWMLGGVPELAEVCFFVDPFSGVHRAAHSQAGLRRALKWLRDGHAVVMFPAGAVAPAREPIANTAVDAPWHATATRMALATDATVLPAFIDGCNSSAFYGAGRIHPMLRTALLPREFLKLRGRRLSVRIGAPMSPERLLNPSADPEAATAALRARVHALGCTLTPNAVPPSMAPAVASEAMAVEIAALPAEAHLLDSGDLTVYCAPAVQIPFVLEEIGRLREVTFRAVGEGTGNAVDLDCFDRHYLHLFVWNRVRREIVGAYRLGPTDTIVGRHGIGGLYTSTLFRFDDRLLSQLSPALELGRSFVRAEYQRGSSALLLLWKGIGRFVVRSRRYSTLFGPVSISRRYADTSQQLLMAFLQQNHGDLRLAELVSPVRPPARMPLPGDLVAQPLNDVAAVDALVARIEGGVGMPVLLRQYLRLNARLLGFNVDPEFGDALDALMAVDLGRVAPAILRRYLGADGAAMFAGTRRRAAA